MSDKEILSSSPYPDDPEGDFFYWVTVAFRDKNNKDTKKILGPYIKTPADMDLFRVNFEECYAEELVRDRLSNRQRDWGINFFDERNPRVINTRGQQTMAIRAEENPRIVAVLKKLREDAPTYVFVVRVRKIQDRKWPYPKAKEEIGNIAAETEFEVGETYESLDEASVCASYAVKKHKRDNDQYRPFWWDDGKICCMTTDSNGDCKRVAIITMMCLTEQVRELEELPDDSIDLCVMAEDVAKAREDYLAKNRKLTETAKANDSESGW